MNLGELLILGLFFAICAALALILHWLQKHSVRPDPSTPLVKRQQRLLEAFSNAMWKYRSNKREDKHG